MRAIGNSMVFRVLAYYPMSLSEAFVSARSVRRGMYGLFGGK
jgi:hypothetical protein